MGAQSETLMINGQKVTTYTINGKTVTQAEFEAFAEAKKKRGSEEGSPAKLRKRAPNDPAFEEEAPAKPIKKRAPNDPELEQQLKTLQLGKPLIDVGQKKAESLGTKTIEGVTAEGTRLTLTIPAGEIGNTLPIEVVDETWYSAELQLVVMSKRRDPRSGETTYRLTNISRSEPDRSLFEVPADYTVQEGNMPLKRKPAKEEE
jgi:hypothetical protein